MSPVTYDYTSRTAVITGGARGIGRGIGERLARAGARVVAWDLQPSHFVSTVNDYRPAAVLAVDVADPASVQVAFARTLELVGHVDILVNNAGVDGPISAVWERHRRLAAGARRQPDRCVQHLPHRRSAAAPTR